MSDEWLLVFMGLLLCAAVLMLARANRYAVDAFKRGWEAGEECIHDHQWWRCKDCARYPAAPAPTRSEE